MTHRKPVPVLLQTCETLMHDAERLRMAHVWGREHNWQPAEDEATLQKAADRIERFRRNLLRLAEHPRTSRGESEAIS